MERCRLLARLVGVVSGAGGDALRAGSPAVELRGLRRVGWAPSGAAGDD